MRRRIEAKDLPRRTMPFRRPFTTTTAVQVFIYSREFSQKRATANNKTSELWCNFITMKTFQRK